MAGFPGFEFAGQVLPSRRPQFRDDIRMLRGEPVLKFVQRLDGGEDSGGDGNGFRFHSLWVRYPEACFGFSLLNIEIIL